MPVYTHTTDACCDCYARTGGVRLGPKERVTIPLGFKLGLPDGWKAVVNPRSGLASKNGVFACVGEIDEGFTGELGCTLFNFSNEEFFIKDKDRICQLEFEPYYHATFTTVDSLEDTERGENGWGSSGLK